MIYLEVDKMKQIILTTIAFLIFSLIPGNAIAGTTDTADVRFMLTAFDNQDFSIFEEGSLIESLVEIIETDPIDAPHHDRVIRGALAVLGELHAPEAVDLLIENLDIHTTTCLYWLGTYAEMASIEAIVEYLDDEDASVRYEAAAALGTVPFSDIDISVIDTGDGILKTVDEALDKIESQLAVEDDGDVILALIEAREHLSEFE